jgi:5'-3' exonuclease
MFTTSEERKKMLSVFGSLKEEKKMMDVGGLSTCVKKSVLLVDGYNTFIRCFAAIPTLNDDGLHTGGMGGFLKSVGAAIKLLQPDKCVIVFDGPGGSAKRRAIYPEYKAHKKTKIRLNRIYEENTSLGDEDISMKKQLQRLVIYLQELPVNMISLDSVEADDTIAHLALDYFKDYKSYIMSSDKDFLQLVSDSVNVWSPIKKRLYGPAEVLTDYGISPQNLVYYRTLDGDDSDNIPGIRGCGLKTAIKAFPFLNGEKIELKRLLEHSEMNKGKLKVYDNIVENWQDVERNYSLMQLTETQLNTFAQLGVKDSLDKGVPKLNRFKLAKLMAEDKLWNTIPNYQGWVTEVFQKLDSFIL